MTWRLCQRPYFNLSYVELTLITADSIFAKSVENIVRIVLMDLTDENYSKDT